MPLRDRVTWGNHNPFSDPRLANLDRFVRDIRRHRRLPPRDDRRATTGRRETYVRMVAASAANGSRVVILRPLPKGRSQHIEGCGRDHEFFRLWVEGCGRLAGGARCSN